MALDFIILFFLDRCVLAAQIFRLSTVLLFSTMQSNAISDKDLMLWFYLFQRKAKLILAYAKHFKNVKFTNKTESYWSRFQLKDCLPGCNCKIAKCCDSIHFIGKLSSFKFRPSISKIVKFTDKTESSTEAVLN